MLWYFLRIILQNEINVIPEYETCDVKYAFLCIHNEHRSHSAFDTVSSFPLLMHSSVQ